MKVKKPMRIPKLKIIYHCTICGYEHEELIFQHAKVYEIKSIHCNTCNDAGAHMVHRIQYL